MTNKYSFKDRFNESMFNLVIASVSNFISGGLLYVLRLCGDDAASEIRRKKILREYSDTIEVIENKLKQQTDERKKRILLKKLAKYRSMYEVLKNTKSMKDLKRIIAKKDAKQYLINNAALSTMFSLSPFVKINFKK